MNTVQKIRKALGLPQTKLYAEARLDDGRVIVTEAESWDVGVEVRILDDSGEATILDAGTYTLEDGTKLVVNEDSRLATLGDDEVEVEVEMETIPEAEEEGYRDGIDDEKEDVREDLDFDKVRDALNQGFPDLGEATIDAIATLVSSLYNDEVVVEAEDVDVKVEEEEEELSSVIEEAFAQISKRLDALEDAPASKGVTHSPNKLSAQHKSVDLSKLNSVDRALHIINSHR
ncbi:MAG: hypothetical protein CMC15_13640 [Flavobacteriaceae bacterium]|nr:hypothetical protein [Flavobacteriaceae bacterium]|tara:strand:- start:2167 stop:2859 length:693 start_codon:yes stop_codon:yes gene_type:complete